MALAAFGLSRDSGENKRSLGGDDEAENALSYPVRYGGRASVLAIPSLGLAERAEFAPIFPPAIRQSSQLVFWHGRSRFRGGTSGFYAK